MGSRSPAAPSAWANWPDTNATSMPESPPAVSLAMISSLVAWYVTVTGVPNSPSKLAGRSSGM